MQQAATRVSDLILEEENGERNWDLDTMTELLGFVHTMQIISTVQLPRGEGVDRLIFSPSTNGEFSVSKAYRHMKEHGEILNQTDMKFWQHIWKKGEVAPRIRLFLWRLISKALPLGKTLLTRGIRVNPTCAICKVGEEDSQHLLFSCPFA